MLKTNKLIVVLSGMLLLVLSVGFFINMADSEIPSGALEYKLLNEDYHSKELKNWVEENMVERGLYTKNFNNKTYIMFTHGEQSVEGYGFKGVKLIKEDDGSVVLSTELIEPSETQRVRSVYYPKIVLEVNHLITESIDFKETIKEVVN